MRILYMCFLGIVCMMDCCPVNFVSQYVEDPQMKMLLKMTNYVVMKIKQQTKEMQQ